METKNTETHTPEEWQKWERRSQRGKILGGVLLVTIGGLLLAREFGAELPWWLFSWKMLLIAIGLISGLKHGFTKLFWMVPLTVGTAFLLNDFYPGLVNTHMLWPVVLIGLGLAFILRSNRRWQPSDMERCKKKRDRFSNRVSPSGAEPVNLNNFDSNLEINAFLGGVEKIVMAKDFKSGEINVVMGGAQVDFSQCDIQDSATLELNAFMGGVKLILPSNWEVKSEVTCVMGGIEDKRKIFPKVEEANRKLLILEGNAVLGGIEIRNY